MNIVYIHGNGASADSFNFIRTQLSEYRSIVLEYESTNGFYNNYQKMLEQLQDVEDIFIVAHSLGGIYALHLANDLRDKVLGAVTMSTPYGGSKAAQAVKYVLPFNRVLRDIQPHSPPIMEGKAIDIVHPWTNIVTLDGHSPFMLEANDGVVTQESMRHRQDMTLVDVNSNHFEVVLNNDAVAIIKKAIKKAERNAVHGLRVWA
ncbi:MAG: esterase/lipase family protein [Noviherbaspirillum sp.]